MKQVGSVVIELVDEATATPAYMMSWEDPWDGGWIDPIDVVACGCGHCSGGCYCVPCPPNPPQTCSWCGRTGCYGECRDTNPGGGGEDGGGGNTEGGGNNGGGGTTSPTGTSIMARPNMPTRMTIQKVNRCVSASMSFVNRIFGGNKKDRDFAKAYKNTFNERIGNDGVPSRRMTQFVDQHFKTTSFTNYKSAIDQGYVVMVAMQEPVNPIQSTVYYLQTGEHYIPGAHSVVVIGYQSGTDQLIVMDPLSGRQDTITESEVLNLYRIVITGNK